MDGSAQCDQPSALPQGKQLTVPTEQEAGGGGQSSDADQNVVFNTKTDLLCAAGDQALKLATYLQNRNLLNTYTPRIGIDEPCCSYSLAKMVTFWCVNKR